MLKKVSSRVRAVSSKTSVAEISISGFPGGLGRGNNLKKKHHQRMAFFTLF